MQRRVIRICLRLTGNMHSSITTPYRLPWFSGIYSLRVLLTPAERRRPWILFLTPGLLVSEVLQIIYVTLVLGPLRSLLFPRQLTGQPGETFTFEKFTPARLSLYIGLMFISTVIICPLEVVSTRLSIQRNHGPSGIEEDNAALDAPYAAVDEDVIG